MSFEKMNIARIDWWQALA